MDMKEGALGATGLCEATPLTAGSVCYGLDYAWHGRIDAGAMKRAGYEFVIRYLSRDRSKDLWPAERDQLLRAGLKLGLVWETTAARATEGYAAGLRDAKEAYPRAWDLGMPKHRPVFFAVDVDASGPQVRPYFEGVRDAFPAVPVGMYGGWTTVDYLHRHKLAGYLWQTIAWMYGRGWHPAAHIHQYDTRTNMVGGASCDLDRAVVPDYGCWPFDAPTPDPEGDEDMTKDERNLLRIAAYRALGAAIRTEALDARIRGDDAEADRLFAKAVTDTEAEKAKLEK